MNGGSSVTGLNLNGSQMATGAPLNPVCCKSGRQKSSAAGTFDPGSTQRLIFSSRSPYIPAALLFQKVSTGSFCNSVCVPTCSRGPGMAVRTLTGACQWYECVTMCHSVHWTRISTHSDLQKATDVAQTIHNANPLQHERTLGWSWKA